MPGSCVRRASSNSLHLHSEKERNNTQFDDADDQCDGRARMFSVGSESDCGKRNALKGKRSEGNLDHTPNLRADG